MTDVQLLTLAVAIIVPLSMLIYSNSRVSDVRASVGEAKETLRAELRAEIAGLRQLIEKNHSELLVKFAEIDGRLTRIENERRIVQ
ncbi:MAG: hypothetical protein ABSH32_19895 [Bryobacteraceae bacterium]|jgi:hypothetical protein